MESIKQLLQIAALNERRLGASAALAGGGIGLLFAAFQVQGWTMPDPVAIFFVVVLAAIVLLALALLAAEVVEAVLRIREHRATSAEWVLLEPPGLLDYEPDGIRAGERFTEEINKLNRDTAELGQKIEKHSAIMNRNMTASGWKKQRLANDAAKDMDKSAVYIEKRLKLLDGCVRDIDRNADGLITAQEIGTDALDGAKEFRDTLKGGHESTTGALTGVAEFRQTMKETEQLNLARTVRIASGRLAKALEGIEKVLRKHASNSLKLASALDRKIAEAERRQAEEG